MKKSIVSQFNSQETVLVITSFPLHGSHSAHQEHFNAVGWHSEKTLVALSHKKKVVVLAEKIGNEKDMLLNKNLLVLRSWKKGDVFSLLKLIPTILTQFGSVKSLFIEFEFNVFGGIVPNLELLLILGLMRLLGKNITFEMHQVITDIKKLEKHINIKNPALQLFFNFGLAFYYWLVGHVTQSIIVFEEELRQRLSKFVRSEKIHTLSLAVMKQKTLEKAVARSILRLPQNKHIFMLFGFINGYKGIDIAIKNFIAHAPKDAVLLVAGGENPYLKTDVGYQLFYKSVVELIKSDKRIIHTGFVADSDVSTYFSAADQLILPYEVFMSASGPFSLSLAHETPVRISTQLARYAQSEDFAISMKEAHLDPSDLFFTLDSKTNMFTLDHNNELKEFTHVLSEKRSIRNVIEKYISVLFPSHHQFKIGFLRPAFPVQ